MEGPIVSHQDEALPEVDGIELGETAPRTQEIQYFHRLAVLQVALARARNSPRGKKRTAQNEASSQLLVTIVVQTTIVVSQPLQAEVVHQPLQTHSDPAGPSHL